MNNLALISGFPGCGKTTFMEWLAHKHQYLHVDMERGGLDRDGLRAKWEQFCNRFDQEAFVTELLARCPKVVLDWNFPPSCLDLVVALQAKGYAIWWFEGDRLAARQRFLQRGAEPVRDFDRHVGEICTAWESIEPVVGENIIRTIAADGTFLAHEVIFKRFAPQSFL